MRVALVHDWLVANRGGESVLAEMCDLFPEAPIYTLVHRPGAVDPRFERHRIVTSFIQRFANGMGDFRCLLPLFPRAVEAWDFSAYDLVLSTSHCVVKGIRTTQAQKHISYIHTPMRYVWDQLPAYLPRVAGRRALLPLARIAVAPLRRWDVRSARRPDLLLANSAYVAARIARYWRRSATVVYPPVDVDFFAAAPQRERRGLVVVAALVPYKGIAAAVRFAAARDLELTVIGDGPERQHLERLAGPGTRFVGHVDRASLRDAYASAKALLHCACEDFGIVPLEATAAGCPVIALAKGGALETVVDGLNGFFYDRADGADLGQAFDKVLDRFASRGADAFNRSAMLDHARHFRRERFREQLCRIIARVTTGPSATV